MNLIKPVYADICNPLLKDCTQVTHPVTYVSNVVSTIFTIFFVVGVVYFIWYFIMGGFHFIDSQGDAKRYEQARQEVTNAVLGLFVVFSVFVVIKLIGVVFGVPTLKDLQLLLPTM